MIEDKKRRIRILDDKSEGNKRIIKRLGGTYSKIERDKKKKKQEIKRGEQKRKLETRKK